jgi:2-polyprenyl-6-methoxyphenol hydroxylase-like FAD-dependent oxidoreductase
VKPISIAIIGAGPAGLATALYAKRAGHVPVIFERFDTAAPVGSGLMLQPTGLTVLDDLGLLPAMMALGQRIDRLAGTDAKTGRTVLDVRYDAQSGGRFGLAVNRPALFDLLQGEALKVKIEIVTGTRVEAAEAGADGIVLAGGGGRRLGRFNLAVDTSGARSKLRHLARVPCEPKPLPYGALWAMLDWRGEGFEAHALTQRYDKASVMAGVLPTGKLEEAGAEKAAFFWSIKPEAFEKVMRNGLEEWKARVLSYWPECISYLNQISSFDDMTLAQYGHHTLIAPIGNRIAFAGDSAHSTSPQLGQGANMALLDARALFHGLDTGSDVADVLERYAKARRWHMRLFQALSAAFTPFYQSDSAALAFIRDRLVSTIARIPPAPKFLAAMVSGTVIDPFKPLGLTETDWRRWHG